MTFARAAAAILPLTALLWASPAAAAPVIETKLHRVTVEYAGGEFWRAYRSEAFPPWNSSQEVFRHYVDWDPGVTVSDKGDLSVFFTVDAKCDGGAERLLGIRYWYDGEDPVFVKLPRITRPVVFTHAELKKRAKYGFATKNLYLEVKCSPAVGKDYYSSRRVLPVDVDLRYDSGILWAKGVASQWAHACPDGYEIDDASKHGYGDQAKHSHAPNEACRRVNPAKVTPAKPKSKNELAIERYMNERAQADLALAALRGAGIDTIYELAHTNKANLNAVLGLDKARAVRTAATNQLAAGSLLDPNWRFNEYFLVDPTWFVDPRIRGTKTAQNKLAKGQADLAKLQGKGIVTLDQLAAASTADVAKLVSGGLPRAKALITAAKKKVTYQGRAWEMAVRSDWVIHPAWVINPGYLPSAEVIRSQPKKPPTTPQVSVHTPSGPATMPPSTKANTKARVDPQRAQGLREAPKHDLFDREGSTSPKDKGPTVTASTPPAGSSSAPKPSGGSKSSAQPKSRRRGIPRSGTGSKRRRRK